MRASGGVVQVLRLLLRGVRHVRQHPLSDRTAAAVLVGLSLLLTAGGLHFGSSWFPVALQILPVLAAGLLLQTRSFLVVAVAAAAGVVAFVVDRGVGVAAARPGSLVLVTLIGLLSYGICRSREETGLVGFAGDTVLAELRRRLSQQGEVPSLPPGWRAEARISPAGGGPFSGDFVVSALTGDGSVLEMALVDVSGKGLAAGVRSLLLSGAMGGLLGSRRPRDLLPAANGYLERQEWDEGFATAAHVVVGLRDGAFLVESAGHPPVAHFDASSGRWSLLEVQGPALGLLPGAEYDALRGVLDVGDALLLYTDGLVEVPGRDLEVGIDKLLGEAERLVPRGFTGGCEQLLSRVAATEGDDRGVVLIWREA
jgi:hypothetical protein